MEIYISTDIEADGPIPGPYSMLSIGAGAFAVTSTEIKLVESFSINLYELADAYKDPKTMEWWATKPEAWELTRQNPVSPLTAMERYRDWLLGLGIQPVFLAWPATFDFMFIYWYFMKFLGESPFKHAGLDAKSYSMALSRKRWMETTMKDLPEGFPPNPMPHVAVNDAIEQGWRACEMLRRNIQ